MKLGDFSNFVDFLEYMNFSQGTLFRFWNCWIEEYFKYAHKFTYIRHFLFCDNYKMEKTISGNTLSPFCTVINIYQCTIKHKDKEWLAIST